MTYIYNDAGAVVGWTSADGIQAKNAELAKWLRQGVPGMKGTIQGDLIIDKPVVIPPDDPFFGLAMLDHFDRIGWSVSEKPKANKIKPSPFTKRFGKYFSKAAAGPCKPGQTAAQTGCTPASGDGRQKPRKEKDPLGAAHQFATANKAKEVLKQLAMAGDWDQYQEVILANSELPGLVAWSNNKTNVLKEAKADKQELDNLKKVMKEEAEYGHWDKFEELLDFNSKLPGLSEWADEIAKQIKHKKESEEAFVGEKPAEEEEPIPDEDQTAEMINNGDFSGYEKVKAKLTAMVEAGKKDEAVALAEKYPYFPSLAAHVDTIEKKAPKEESDSPTLASLAEHDPDLKQSLENINDNAGGKLDWTTLHKVAENYPAVAAEVVELVKAKIKQLASLGYWKTAGNAQVVFSDYEGVDELLDSLLDEDMAGQQSAKVKATLDGLAKAGKWDEFNTLLADYSSNVQLQTWAAMIKDSFKGTIVGPDGPMNPSEMKYWDKDKLLSELSKYASSEYVKQDEYGQHLIANIINHFVDNGHMDIAKTWAEEYKGAPIVDDAWQKIQGEGTDTIKNTLPSEQEVLDDLVNTDTNAKYTQVKDALDALSKAGKWNEFDALLANYPNVAQLQSWAALAKSWYGPEETPKNQFPTNDLDVDVSQWDGSNINAVSAVGNIATYDKLANEGKWDTLAAIAPICYTAVPNQYLKAQMEAYQTAMAKKPSAEDTTIADMKGWSKVGAQEGSNPGGKYKAPDGTKYYVKFSKSPEIAKNEALAASLYELAGAAVPKVNLINTSSGHLGIASKWEDKTAFDSDNPQDQEAAYENLGVHLWLANYDALGKTFDNQAWVTDPATGKKKLITVDVGGSLTYRAQGVPKTDFDDDVHLKMLDPKHNKNAAKVFKGITPSQMLNAYQKVAMISNGTIYDMVWKALPGEAGQALAQKLINRKADIEAKAKALAAQLGVQLGEASTTPTKPSAPAQTAPPPAAEPVKVFKLPAEPVCNDKVYKAKFQQLTKLASAGDAKSIEKFPTKADAKAYVGQKLHKYKMAILAALKGGVVPSATPSATPLTTSPSKPGHTLEKLPGSYGYKLGDSEGYTVANLPSPTKSQWNTSKTKQVGDAIDDLATEGDIAAIEAIEKVYGKVSTYVKLKAQAKIANLKSKPNVSKAPVEAPAPAAPAPANIKITVDDLPATPEFHNKSKPGQSESNLASCNSIKELALKADLAGLQSFTTTPSPKVKQYLNDCILSVKNKLYPPPPPKPFTGDLDSLKGSYIKGKGGKDVERIADYMVVDSPGVPTIDYEPFSIDHNTLVKAHAKAIMSLNPVEKSVISNYTGHGYQIYSPEFRKGKPSPEALTMAKAIINKGLELPPGAIIKRGAFNGTEEIRTMLKNSVGKVLQDPAFGSASIKQGFNKAIRFHFTVSPGCKALYVESTLGIGGEREVILPPGYQFLITKVSNKKGFPGENDYPEGIVIEAILLPTKKDQYTGAEVEP